MPAAGVVAYSGIPPALIPPPFVPPSQPPPDRPPLPDTPAFWPAVIAIVLSSLCFSIVHPMWTWPVIFVLSCMLGYAYERTGSLWVPIVMHAMFNISSTFLFLNFM